MKKLYVLLSLTVLIGCSGKFGTSGQPFSFEDAGTSATSSTEEQKFDDVYKKDVTRIEKKENIKLVRKDKSVVKATAPTDLAKPTATKKTTVKKTVPVFATSDAAMKKIDSSKEKKVSFVPEKQKTTTKKATKKVVVVIKDDDSSEKTKKEKITKKDEVKTMRDILFDEQDKAAKDLAHSEKIRMERVWLTKPISKEVTTLSNGQTIEEELHETLAFLNATDEQICLDHPRLDFIKEAYQKMLISASACCRNNIAYLLEYEGASNNSVYGFLVDDYNFYRAGELCLFYSDSEIHNIFGETLTGKAVQTARNSCLCQNKSTVGRDVAIMRQIMHHPRLKGCPTGYQTVDEFGRYTNRNIINDLEKLNYHTSFCPK